MSGHRDEFIELCAAYAVGSLDRRDRERLESHLAGGCPECEAAIHDFTYGATLLASSAPQARPAPELRTRVIDAIAADRTPEGHGAAEREGGAVRWPRERRGWFPWVGWAAAAIFAVTAGTLFESSGKLREIVRAREAEVGDLARQLALERQWTAVLSAPGARVTEMTLTPEGQALRGRAIYDPRSRRAVVVLENATPPSDKDYELWAIRGGAPVSLGLVRADERGNAVVRLENVGDPGALSAIAISLEPKGGSPSKTAPSGPVVMVGALKG